ncbi:hypothetical protein KUCAC02_028425 [Chaenocephalus aceratus]|uniref:Uncharacterized protein n=1 Tax=Chaenocephalus aceratus TaxID=36190 RepID=A0ACB9X2Y6_CHAAC|nr:hypothetical protein KUCAC02_028425 [Chaenocephalus aceratus]
MAARSLLLHAPSALSTTRSLNIFSPSFPTLYQRRGTMVRKSFLKVKEGHFVAVKRISGAGLELCVVELKNQASSVKIWTREKETKYQIAFSFLRDGDDYSPKVKEEKLQLEKIADVSDHEPYWFEKVDLQINEHYGLRSVVNGHYLMKTVRHALSSQMSSQMKREETNYTFDNITADFPAGGPPSQQKEPVRVNGQEVRFFTPVRRSVRIERSSLRYPASLQEHDLCVASYADLISEEDAERSEEQEGGETSPYADNTPMYVYRQNEALEDKVFVKLVYDEDV